VNKTLLSRSSFWLEKRRQVLLTSLVVLFSFNQNLDILPDYLSSENIQGKKREIEHRRVHLVLDAESLEKGKQRKREHGNDLALVVLPKEIREGEENAPVDHSETGGKLLFLQLERGESLFARLEFLVLFSSSQIVGVLLPHLLLEALHAPLNSLGLGVSPDVNKVKNLRQKRRQRRKQKHRCQI
jgi:hypothetical protein